MAHHHPAGEWSTLPLGGVGAERLSLPPCKSVGVTPNKGGCALVPSRGHILEIATLVNKSRLFAAALKNDLNQYVLMWAIL